MQGINLYLASKTEEENLIVRRRIECLTSEFSKLRFVGLHPQGLAMSAHEKMTVVVLNLPEWTHSEMRYVRDARAAGYNGPILVMAKSNGSAALRNLRAMNGVVFLEKPFVTKDLVGIVRKMLLARVVAQRIHRRFNTDEMAELEFYGRNDRYATKMTNLSKGGAFVEFPHAAPVKIGDMLRMTIELKKVSRVYTVPARVVWTAKGGAGTGVGVEFVGVPDIERTIEEF